MAVTGVGSDGGGGSGGGARQTNGGASSAGVILADAISYYSGLQEGQRKALANDSGR